jgi:hypothetical protein
MGQRGVEFEIADLCQALASGPADADGGEAPLEVAAVTPEMLDDESLHEGQAGGIQSALLGQDLRHGAVPGLGPGMEGGDELGLTDQPRLERQQAEEQVARGVGRTRHDRRLPSPLSRSKKTGKVLHRIHLMVNDDDER